LWHDEADRREHTTSEEKAQELAARLGHPRYDPHGAPIPTPGGDLPSTRGVALSNAESGERGIVVHVEDEPKATYEQLAAQGITVGATVCVLERSPQRIRLEVDGEEQVLAPIVAGHVSIERVERSTGDAGAAQRLSQLLPGMKGRVVSILPSCRGIQRRRLLDLGLLSGTVVEAELQGPGGDPRAYRIRGALIALREGQSKLIQIERLPEDQSS
jgi:DtxR family Mn-dependent transcriptional regulator